MIRTVNRLVGAASTAGTYISLGLIGYEVVKMAYPHVSRYFSSGSEPFTNDYDSDSDCVVELVVKPKRKKRKMTKRTTIQGNNQGEDIIEDIPGIKDIDAKYRERLNEEDPNVPSTSSASFLYKPSSDKPIEFDENEGDDEDAITSPETSSDEHDKSHVDPDMICHICGDYLLCPDKEVSALPFCDHLFHQKCIQGVMTFNQKCPKCASSIFTPI